MIELICRCGNKFNVKPSRIGKAKYCSYQCSYKYADRSHLLKYKGELHPKWAADKVGINGVHGWIRKMYGSAKICEHCGRTRKPKGYKIFFHWANISQKYKRERSDWKQLCMVCHGVFDHKTKLSPEQVQAIKQRYKNGEFITILAPEYGVGTSTIHRIIHNKIAGYAK